MCEIFDEIRQEGEQRGIEIGEQRGIEIGEQRGIEINLLDNLRNLMANLHVTAQDAMSLLGVPEEQRAHYGAML